MHPDDLRTWIVKLINPPEGYYSTTQLKNHYAGTRDGETQPPIEGSRIRSIDQYTTCYTTKNNELIKITAHELPQICQTPIYFTDDPNNPSEPVHTATYTIEFSTDSAYSQITTNLKITFHGTNAELIQNELKRIQNRYKAELMLHYEDEEDFCPEK